MNFGFHLLGVQTRRHIAIQSTHFVQEITLPILKPLFE